MLQRYISPAFQSLWSEQTKLEIWLRVELAVGEALETVGHLPVGSTEALRVVCTPVNVEEVAAIEEQTHHDVVAFLNWVEHRAEAAALKIPWFHYGLTSSDVVDTALALRLQTAVAILQDDLVFVIGRLATLVRRHQHTRMLGRTHGQHAEATTFGFVLAGHLAEFDRRVSQLREVYSIISVGKLSGAVGTHRFTSFVAEDIVFERLGLTAETVPTQIVARDRLVTLVMCLAQIANAVERLALRLRLLQQTEIAECAENVLPTQIGSSAMPHKRNPIQCETLCGLARLVRCTIAPMLESACVWHERDMTHSSVERVVLPDATALTGKMLTVLSQLLSSLDVNKEKMRTRVDQHVDTEAQMLAHVRDGVRRSIAHRMARQRRGTAQQTAAIQPHDLESIFLQGFLQRRST